MVPPRKLYSIIIFLLLTTSGFAQNHRQFANWIGGDFSIIKKVNEVDVKIATTQIVNLSNIDSNNYWLVEDMSFAKYKRQRVLHVQLLDSGYVGVDTYELKNNKAVSVLSNAKQIKLENYQKSNQTPLIFNYNRSARGYELLRNSNHLFYLDNVLVKLFCCSDFSKFYFDEFKNESKLLLIKNTD